MKLAVFSESSADEAALRILAQGILGTPAEGVDLPSLRTRGWPSVLDVLPVVMKAVHYHTDADGLVVVVDSDLWEIHAPEHDSLPKPPEKCRFCRVRAVAQETRKHLKRRPGRSPLRVAVGLAVPCIEAWLRCGIDLQVTEASWRQALQINRFPYDSRRLKVAVYGTDRPSLPVETARMEEEARRLAACIDDLIAAFPAGFGELARELRSW